MRGYDFIFKQGEVDAGNWKRISLGMAKPGVWMNHNCWYTRENHFPFTIQCKSRFLHQKRCSFKKSSCKHKDLTRTSDGKPKMVWRYDQHFKETHNLWTTKNENFRTGNYHIWETRENCIKKLKFSTRKIQRPNTKIS